MRRPLLLASAVLFGALTAYGQCLLWQQPTPSNGTPPFPTGWTDFNSQFGGAPCTANPPTTFEITAFQVYAAEAYQMNNIIAGGQYRFSTCNGASGSWPIRFTILTPTGTVDAFGIDAGSTCAITWTASQTGSYTIVINQAGASNCGGGPNQATDNGFPAITYLGGATCPSAPTCSAGTLIAPPSQNLCGPTGTATIGATGVTFPAGGRTGILFRPAGGSGALGGAFILTFASAATFPYTFNSNLNGLLSANGFPPFSGTWTAKTIATTSTTFASICDSSAASTTLNFLPINAPGCVPVTACIAGTLNSPATQALCPGQTGVVNITGQTIPNSPTAGTQGVLFRPGNGGSGALGGAFILTGVTYPYNFDADLNGVLSNNNFPPLSGEWILRGAVSSNAASPFASICDTTVAASAVTFLAPGSPACAPPANDNICSATAIACGDQLAGTTFQASQSIAPVPCDGFTAASALDVWYSFTANGTLDYSFTTNGFDAVLSIYSGNCNAPVFVVCSDDEFDDSETINAGVLPAGNYFLRVYSYFAADAGAFSVTMNCTCPLGAPGTPCNDGNPNTTNDQVTFDCQCVGTPVVTCNVDGGTVTTTSPRLNLCIGDGQPNIIQLTVTGNVGVGRFGLVQSPSLNVVAVNTNGLFNMENFPPGSYFVGHVSVPSLSALAGITNVNQLTGCFDLSNQLPVTSFGINGGVITTSGPTNTCPTTLSFSVTGQQGNTFRWAVLNQTLTTVLANNNTGVFNFALLGPGIYRVVHVATGPGVNLSTIDPQNLQGCIDASNIITVTIQNCPTASISTGTKVYEAMGKSMDMAIAKPEKQYLKQGAAPRIGSFDVFPNPSKGQVNAMYNAEKEGNVQVMMYDVVGKLVYSNNFATSAGENLIAFNFANFEAGLYTMTIVDSGKLSTQRMVITK
jgi:hypothetical protein